MIRYFVRKSNSLFNSRLEQFASKKKKVQQKAQLRPVYNIFQAIQLVKCHSIRPFEESVDIVFRMGVDPKHGEQNIRGTCQMPGGLGKTKRIAVLADKQFDQQLQSLGVEFYGEENILNLIKAQKLDFEVLFTTSDYVSVLKPYGRTLGPKGLMPNTKVGTLVPPAQLSMIIQLFFNYSPKLVQSVKDAFQGQISYRLDKGANIHAPLGKINFDDERIIQNIKSVAESLSSKRPQGFKGNLIKECFLKSSMGPSFQIATEYIDPKNKNYQFLFL